MANRGRRLTTTYTESVELETTVKELTDELATVNAALKTATADVKTLRKDIKTWEKWRDSVADAIGSDSKSCASILADINILLNTE